MTNAAELNLLSLPMIAVGPLSLLVCWLSLTLEWRRADERALLSAYRWLAVLNILVLAVGFLALNGWLERAPAVRLLAGGVAALPVILLNYERISSGRTPNRLALVLFGLCGIAWLVLAADRGAFTVDVPRSAGPGSWLVPFAGFLLGIYALAAYQFLQPATLQRTRGITLVGVLLALTTALDASTLIFNWSPMPFSWLGTLALIFSFSRLMNRHYRNMYQSLREAQQEREDLQREREDLERQVIHDELTGLYTRAHAITMLESILPSRGACVVFIDIDDFKAWNDNFGHATGDRVLREVAQAIRTSVRFGDIPARYAGDEFFVVLPGARLDAGRRVAETIRRKMLESTVELDAAPVTASFGVALGDETETAAELLDRADRATYQAKRAGKNRISSRSLQMKPVSEHVL